MVWCTPEENLFCICAMWNSSWMYTWATHTHTHTRYADVNDICFCIATHTCGNGFHSFCFWPVQLFRLCQSCNHWIYRKSSHNNNNLVEQSSWTTILHISSKYKMIERKDTRWVWDVKEKWVVPFSFVWKWVRCTQRHTHTNTLEVFAFSWTVQFTQIKLTHGTSSFYLLPLCVWVCLLYDRGSPPKAAPAPQQQQQQNQIGTTYYCTHFIHAYHITNIFNSNVVDFENVESSAGCFVRYKREEEHFFDWRFVWVFFFLSFIQLWMCAYEYQMREANVSIGSHPGPNGCEKERER